MTIYGCYLGLLVLRALPWSALYCDVYVQFLVFQSHTKRFVRVLNLFNAQNFYIFQLSGWS